MLVRPRVKPGAADTSDLRRNRVVTWQHRWYFYIAFFFGLIVPACVPGYLWSDWRGGFFYAGCLRLTFVHHVSSRFRGSHISALISHRSCVYHSLFLASIPSRTGSGRRRSMINCPRGTILSLLLLLSEKGITIFITSSRWTIEMPSSGISMIRQNGSSRCALTWVSPPTSEFSRTANAERAS